MTDGGHTADRTTAPVSSALDPPNLTDRGNAARFAAYYRGWAHYVHAWKSWVVWSTTHWARDDNGRAVELAKRIVDMMHADASDPDLPDDARALLKKHAIRTEAAPRLHAMLDLAQSEPGIPASPDEFDTDPWLLSAPNGTIDLRTGHLRPHRPDDKIMRAIATPYDPEAACPRWLAFLNEIMASNATLIRFLQKSIGYALTGSIREQCLFILWGAGANGKSTFLNVVTSLLGPYALQTPMETFMQKTYDQIPNDIARLHGVRFVSATEAEQQRRLAEALIKSLTGGDKIVARFLHREFFEFTPRFKIFLATNHKPIIRGTDHAIWRRIRLIPFTVTIPDDRQDKELVAKLAEEYPGILAWAVAGCRLWLQEGLGMPDEVRAAIEVYRGEMDTVGNFLHDCCEISPALSVSAKALYASYVVWAQRVGERPMSQKALGMALGERGFTPEKGSAGARYWTGLAVRPEALGSETPPQEGREPGEETLPF